MKIMNYFRKMADKFKKSEKVEDYQLNMISSAIFKDNLKDNENFGCSSCNCSCKYSTPMKNTEYNICDCNIQCSRPYNPELDTFLIIDDHQGVVSFLKDDINTLQEEGFIKKDINIINVYGSQAAFCLEVFIEQNEIKITKAIIDITLGGSVNTEDGNLRYTGVDVYGMCLKNNKDFEYTFYTGNNLNPYIKSNKVIIDKYKEISGGKELKDDSLFKTSLDMDSRIEYLKNLMRDF